MSESAKKKQRLSPETAIAVTPSARTDPRRLHCFAHQGLGEHHGEDQQHGRCHRDEMRQQHHMRSGHFANEPMRQGHQEITAGETPRDMLRDLAKALKNQSRPVEPSPQTEPRRTRHSALDLPDVEDGPDLAAPRLSMALDDMYDDDSIHEHPPRQSLLPELPDDVDGGTVQSLEFGRRAFSEDPRLVYPSRVSERFADLSELGAVEEEYEVDGTFVSRRDGILEQTIDEALDEDDTTTQIRALTGRRDGRPSDVDLGVFGEADDDTEEPTFRFLIPERIRAPPRGELVEDQDVDDALDGFPNLEDDISEPNDMIVEDLEDDVATALEGADVTETAGIQGWESDNDLGDDADLALYREEESAMDRSLQTQSPEKIPAKQPAVRRARELRTSRRGLEYPSFPTAPVKKLALSFMKSQGSKAQLNKDAVAALVRVTDDFFEQMGIDLAAYAEHGGRKMIEESDVIALMKRTRKTTNSSTSFSLAQKMLPRELLQQLRMEPPKKLRGQKRKRLNTVQEEDEG
ncbi:centromere kinetochore component CENP-T-domain-containing protein [Phaeosphaeria sp. MPI-PUGE-AT-0046c]|nr:centromere kinetochore component CENP-T-domain-containing protein [Phaeosphaeria sp. MPI-PUGE-AT-0046c]